MNSIIFYFFLHKIERYVLLLFFTTFFQIKIILCF